MVQIPENIIPKERIITNKSMAEYTTFGTGGKAELIIEPKTLQELKSVVKYFYESAAPYYVLGNGSNLLVSDGGVSKPVIHMGKEFSAINVFENCITAQAGARLASIAQKALENSLTGMEFAAGIPGTLGGALIMNAGAYGGEMKDITEAVSFVDISGEEHIVSGEEMEFGYRKSALSDTDCIITGATLILQKGNKEDITAKMAELAQKRREKQPLEYRSAGSTFKRPVGNFAGTLIESCGLKGYRSGGAMVSEKHAGFVINYDNANTEDIINVINHVKECVYSEHGIMLETEVKYWE